MKKKQKPSRASRRTEPPCSHLSLLAAKIADDLFGGANRLVCEEHGETINRRGWSKKCMADRICGLIQDAILGNANTQAEGRQ